jgi:hypothetical protein
MPGSSSGSTSSPCSNSRTSAPDHRRGTGPHPSRARKWTCKRANIPLHGPQPRERAIFQASSAVDRSAPDLPTIAVGVVQAAEPDGHDCLAGRIVVHRRAAVAVGLLVAAAGPACPAHPGQDAAAIAAGSAGDRFVLVLAGRAVVAVTAATALLAPAKSARPSGFPETAAGRQHPDSAPDRQLSDGCPPADGRRPRGPRRLNFMIVKRFARDSAQICKTTRA